MVVYELLFSISAPSKWDVHESFNVKKKKHFPGTFGKFSDSLFKTVQDFMKPLNLMVSEKIPGVELNKV